MDYEKREHLLKDLAKLAKGHGLTLMFGRGDQITQLEKEYDGITLFITDGTKPLCVRGGESIAFTEPSFFTITRRKCTDSELINIKVQKNRFKKDETDTNNQS